MRNDRSVILAMERTVRPTTGGYIKGVNRKGGFRLSHRCWLLAADRSIRCSAGARSFQPAGCLPRH